MRVRIVEAEESHIKPIAHGLRSADAHEVWAFSRFYPSAAVRFSLKASERTWTLLYLDKPIMMFGVARDSLLSNTGVPWLLGTNDIMSIRLTVLKLSRGYIDKMLENFDLLENYVHSENLVSIHWLKWCGFTIEKAQALGPDKELFNRFWKRKG